MRKQTNFLIYPLLLIGVFFVFAGSCKKDDDDNGDINAGKPEVTTTTVTDITQTTAKSGGNITSDGEVTVTARGVCWSIGQTPTTTDNKTTDGTGAGEFSSLLIGLVPNTTYYVRAYATNSYGTAYGSPMSFTTQNSSGNTFTDPRDGNVYQTEIIGNQEWMAENLAYLPYVSGPGTGSQTTPYYYVYGYFGTDVNAAKATSKYTTYGVLYNWPAAMAGSASSSSNPSGVQGVCPVGWHLPSDAEWTELIDYMGGESVAGGKLKESGTMHWNSPNTGATNETGFTALPGGSRINFGVFNYVGSYGYWWSATESGASDAWSRYMSYGGSNAFRNYYTKELGYSVRCVRD